MESNSVHEREFEIDAIPLNCNEKKFVKINVKLNDNRAIFQYNSSLNELQIAKEKCKSIEEELKDLECKFNISLKILEKSMYMLKCECKGYNLTNELESELTSFDCFMNDNTNISTVAVYVEKIFKLLDKNYLICNKAQLTKYVNLSLHFCIRNNFNLLIF